MNRRAVVIAAVTAALAAMAAWPAAAASSGFVPVDGGKLYYEVAGSGPALVLVHDGLLHSVSWDAQVPAFAAHYRTIRYDRRGYGRSETSTRRFSAVDDLLAVLEYLKVESAVLVACSAGGGLAVDFTLAHPQRVAGLVLEGAVISGIAASAHFNERNLRHLAPAFMRHDVAATIDAWVNDPYLTDPHSTAARARLREILTAHPHQVDGSDPSGLPPARPAAGRLREIHVPTLILVGASDIPDVQAQAGVLEAGIANARRVVIPATGHLAHLEQPAAFNAAVLGFLRPAGEATDYLLSLGDLTRYLPDGPKLYGYDAGAPLDVAIAGSEVRGNGSATVVDLTYASPLAPPGGRVPAYLVLPRRPAQAAQAPEATQAAQPPPQAPPAAAPPRHPAAVFVHPGQGDRSTFLDEAIELAGRGLVSLLIGAPSTRPEHVKSTRIFDADADRRELVQLALDVRRGLDLLAARGDVDPGRLGYVGHSLGATAAGPLIPLETRIQAFVMMAGFASQTREWEKGASAGSIAFRTLLTAGEQKRYLETLAPIDGVRFLGQPRRVPVLFQFARRDEYISPWDAALWEEATAAPHRSIWYDTGHAFDANARQDRDLWLLLHLGLGQPPPAAALFDLRSEFWVNLHHFLHGLGRRGDDPEPATGGPLTPAERQVWQAALASYRRNWAQRDLLFDRGMATLNAGLSAAGNSPDLSSGAPGATPDGRGAAAGGGTNAGTAGAGAAGSTAGSGGEAVPADLAATLRAAAPIYRAHWWPVHDQSNRAWIAAVRPLLDRCGRDLARRIQFAYRVDWPADPILADVTVDAGRVGAYTTDEPFVHITISSRDSRATGNAALETLFHEASHGWDQELIDGIERAAADRGRPVPDSLWHAVLFYTAGESTRATLADAGDPGYVPYAVANHVYERGPMRPYPPALAAAWQPYLDGQTDFASALLALIDTLAQR